MENIFRKYGWAMRLGLIAVACFLLAMGINAFVASKLAPYTVPTLPDLTASKDSGAPNKGAVKNPRAVNRVKTIAGRCYFGCVEPEEAEAKECKEPCAEGEKCVEGVCVPEQPVSEQVSGDLPVESDLNVKLVGVMVSNKPQWSTALIQEPASKQAYVARPEDMILGEATLLEVKRDRIIIERNGRREYIRLQNTITGNPSPNKITPRVTSAPSTAAPPSTARPSDEEQAKAKAVGPSVQQVSKGAFRVDRSALDEKLQDRASLAKDATIIPNYKNGKKAGLKLMNIQSSSVYNQIGLQNGDVIRSVNGEEIKSQAHAMELFEKFRKADVVRLELERNGKRETYNYDIK
jgi:general secretion pathway protein C